MSEQGNEFANSEASSARPENQWAVWVNKRLYERMALKVSGKSTGQMLTQYAPIASLYRPQCKAEHRRDIDLVWSLRVFTQNLKRERYSRESRDSMGESKDLLAMWTSSNGASIHNLYPKIEGDKWSRDQCFSISPMSWKGPSWFGVFVGFFVSTFLRLFPLGGRGLERVRCH